MFQITGQPGWMRFGFSPGWGGMPPGAQYLQQTGQVPQATNWVQQSNAEAQEMPDYSGSGASISPQMTGFSKDQEIENLKMQLQQFENAITQIKEKIKQLKE